MMLGSVRGQGGGWEAQGSLLRCRSPCKAELRTWLECEAAGDDACVMKGSLGSFSLIFMIPRK